MGVKLKYLALREEYRLEVKENRTPRRILSPMRNVVAGEECVRRSFIMCIFTKCY
jgi:hypothetical protein